MNNNDKNEIVKEALSWAEPPYEILDYIYKKIKNNLLINEKNDAILNSQLIKEIDKNIKQLCISHIVGINKIINLDNLGLITGALKNNRRATEELAAELIYTNDILIYLYLDKFVFTTNQKKYILDFIDNKTSLSVILNNFDRSTKFYLFFKFVLFNSYSYQIYLGETESEIIINQNILYEFIEEFKGKEVADYEIQIFKFEFLKGKRATYLNKKMIYVKTFINKYLGNFYCTLFSHNTLPNTIVSGYRNNTLEKAQSNIIKKIERSYLEQKIPHKSHHRLIHKI